MARQVEQSIDFLDGNMFRSVGDLHDLVARADLSFFEDTAIKPWSLMRDEKRRHLRVVHSDTDAIASHSRLSHFKQRTTDPVAISDANLIIRQTIDCQVFAELAVLKVMSLEIRLPVAIRVDLIHHHGAVLSAVSRKITLSIAIEIQPARHHSARYWPLPDSGVNYLALPCYVAWKTDVQRDKRRHDPPSLRREFQPASFILETATWRYARTTP